MKKHTFISLSVCGLLGVALLSLPQNVSGTPGLDSDALQAVLGGGCVSCYNSCGGGGCSNSRCAADDVGEYCGSPSTGSGNAWNCVAWGSTTRCETSGGSITCSGTYCVCGGTNDCRESSTAKNMGGSQTCTDN